MASGGGVAFGGLKERRGSQRRLWELAAHLVEEVDFCVVVALQPFHHSLLVYGVVALRRRRVVGPCVGCGGRGEIAGVIFTVGHAVEGVGALRGGSRCRSQREIFVEIGFCRGEQLHGEACVAAVVAGQGQVRAFGVAGAEVRGEQLVGFVVIAGTVVAFAEPKVCFSAERGVEAAVVLRFGEVAYCPAGVAALHHACAREVEHLLARAPLVVGGARYLVESHQGCLIVVVVDISAHHIVLHLRSHGAGGVALEEILEQSHRRPERCASTLEVCHGIVVVGHFAGGVVEIHPACFLKGH